MKDLYDQYKRRVKGDKNKWRPAWQDEIKRRLDSGFPAEDEEIIAEIKHGVWWECPKCVTEYRIRTPFRKLYCSNEYCGLTRLRCHRMLPIDRAKRPGYWLFEDDRSNDVDSPVLEW